MVSLEVFNVVEHIKEGALDLQRGSLHMGGHYREVMPCGQPLRRKQFYLSVDMSSPAT